MEYVYATRSLFSWSIMPVVICGAIAAYALASTLDYTAWITHTSDEHKKIRKNTAIAVVILAIITTPFVCTSFSYASSINQAAEAADQINAVNNVEKPGMYSFYPLPEGSDVEKCSVKPEHPMTYMWVGDQLTRSVPTEETAQRINSKASQCSLKVVEDIPEDTSTTFRPTETNFLSGKNERQSQALKDAIKEIYPDQFVTTDRTGTSASVTDINGHQTKQYIAITRDSENSKDSQTIHIFDKTKIN